MPVAQLSLAFSGPAVLGSAPSAPAAPALSLHELERVASDYEALAYTDNTKRAYQSNWDAFSSWCARHGLSALPASPQTLRLYLAHLAATGKKASTIRRARVAIGQAHAHADAARPDRHACIRALERSIARKHGDREEGATPLLEHELARAVAMLGDSAREDRDRALLLLGYTGGFRRTELAGLDVTDVVFTPYEARISLRKSKEDQTGKGHTRTIPNGQNASTCPVLALKRWMARMGRPAGPLFRAIYGGRIEHERMSDKCVARAVQRVIARAGLAGSYSAHSLRKGLISDAKARGATNRELQVHLDIRCAKTIERYDHSERVPGRPHVAEGSL